MAFRCQPSKSSCWRHGQSHEVTQNWLLLAIASGLQASNTNIPVISLEDLFEARWAAAMALRNLCFVLLAAGPRCGQMTRSSARDCPSKFVDSGITVAVQVA